jgi:penicillin V acylase-like amidase (Ntn superfamily)
MKWIVFTLSFCIVVSAAPTCISCSVFGINDKSVQVVGKNYDWMVDDGLLVVNKRNVKKTAFVYFQQPSEHPARWVSKFGSITFNQFGCGLPNGGMNEKGLIVEAFILFGGSYPTTEGLSSISQLQWTQYQLDNYATVTEVVNHVEGLRIRPTKGAPVLHHFIWDRTGNWAVIDWIEGKARITSKSSEVLPVMTNIPYSLAIEHWKNRSVPEKDIAQSSLRFSKIADQISSNSFNTNIEAYNFAFRVLDSVQWEYPTMWQIVYDPINLHIKFKTRVNNEIRYVDMKHLDFDCRKPMLVLDINAFGKGDVGERLLRYDREINRELIKNVLLKTPFIKKAPPEVLSHRSQYIDTHNCEN